MPKRRVRVPVRKPFVDERGQILNLVDAPFTSAAVITSVKGAVRGNHYHKTDYHYCWLQRGGMILYQRRVGDRRPPKLFWKFYVKKQGRRDGTHGLVFSILFAFTHFLLWAKYWEGQHGSRSAA